MGVRDSIPIALGYLTVSLAFGLYCAKADVMTWVAALISASNMSSSGQFAGINIILASGSLVQLGLTVALVNLRYILMSFSLSQRLEPGMGTARRLLISWCVTDEIYALAMRRHEVTFAYYTGLMVLPVLGWTGGTIAGALVGQVLPQSLQSAFGVLLYAMFVAIVVTPAKKSRAIQLVVLVAGVSSVILHLIPFTAGLQDGWKIIIATLIASSFGATVFPIPEMPTAGRARTGQGGI